VGRNMWAGQEPHPGSNSGSRSESSQDRDEVLHLDQIEDWDHDRDQVVVRDEIRDLVQVWDKDLIRII
jgi:hypothetical protein